MRSFLFEKKSVLIKFFTKVTTSDIDFQSMIDGEIHRKEEEVG